MLYLSDLAWFSNIPRSPYVSIHMLILFLQIRGHCGKHETVYVEHIIAMLLMSSAICNSQTSREVIRVRFCKNILYFLLPENTICNDRREYFALANPPHNDQDYIVTAIGK
jgi:hypothetical protein